MKTLTIKTCAVLFTAFAALTMLDSCQKEKATTPNTTPVSITPEVNNFVYVNQAINDVQTALMSSNKSAFKTMTVQSAFSSCATVTVDTSTLPYTKTWDFGTGCTGSDGHFRSGKIIVTYNSNNFKQAGDTANINLATYACDTLQFAGGISAVSYTDGSGYLNYAYVLNMSVTTGGVTYPDTGTMNWQWIAGMGSSGNDQFSITATLNGYDKQHNNQVIQVTNPLIRNFNTPNCNYFIQGDYSVTTNGTLYETVDFGTGTCTGTETITQGAKIYTQNQ